MSNDPNFLTLDGSEKEVEEGGRSLLSMDEGKLSYKIFFAGDGLKTSLIAGIGVKRGISMKPSSSRLRAIRDRLIALGLLALAGHVHTASGTPTPLPAPLEEEDYAAWETTHGITSAGSDEDSDGDGIPNGIEFVIGGDPSGPDSDSNSLLPTITVAEEYVTFVFRRTDDSASYNPFVEYGSALSGWTEAEGGVDGVTIAEDNGFFGAGIDRVRMQIPRTLAVGSKLFARLRVDIP